MADGFGYELRAPTLPAGAESARFGRTVAWQLVPTILLIVVFLIIASGLLYHSALQQNAVAERAGRHLAASVMGMVYDEMRNFVRDYAFWNDTVDHLLVSYDAVWADNNVGQWAIDGLGMDGAVVFGAGNRIVHRAAAEGSSLLADPGTVPKAVAALIDIARRQLGAPGVSSTAASGYFRVGGTLHFATAAGISWEDDRPPFLDGDEPGVLLFFRTVDETLLSELETRFLLQGLHLTLDDPRGGMLPLKSSDGRILGGLTWTIEQPGTVMLKGLAGPLAVSALIMLAVVAMIVRHAVRSARQVQTYHDHLESRAYDLRAAWTAAETANRSKSRFLAMMSHELRTPLNAIIGFSDFMRLSPPGSLSQDRTRGYAEDIHTSGSYLLALINDILDMSKIESQRYELYEEPVVLDEVVEQVLTLTRGMAVDRSIVLRAPKSNLTLRADARAMKQIILNLVSNAVKFSDPDGVVRIEAGRRGSTGIEIKVRDTGIGMGKTEMEKALQPFGQTKDAHIRNMDGTGLGLNIAQALTELHGGALILESEPGLGTTVTIRLPASRLVAPTPDSAETAADGRMTDGEPAIARPSAHE